MTKAELVAKMAEAGSTTKAAATRELDCLVQCIVEEVAAGNRVQLVGLGTFEPRKRAARTGRNPQNPKEIIKIPAKTVPAFKAGTAFKEAVAKGKKK